MHVMLDSLPAALHYLRYNAEYTLYAMYMHAGVGMQWLQLGHTSSSMEG